MEVEVKIVLVPKEQLADNIDMFRVSCEAFYYSGWGRTLEEAIRDFDRQINLYGRIKE